jgi:hypothetical protein
VAIEQDAHSWADVKTIDDLGKQFQQETHFAPSPQRAEASKHGIMQEK